MDSLADVISYGDGSHSGNPNMGTARSSSMATFMALVPDHPMYEKWRKHMSGYLEYKISSQTAPGGGYFEFGTAYHMHGFARLAAKLPQVIRGHRLTNQTPTETSRPAPMPRT